jgi:hypothetical protein
VSKTLGKGYFTLGKEHSAKISSAKGSLPSVKKHSAKKNTRQIKNRKNKKKQQNIFLNSRKNSPILPITLSVALSFFTIILNQI